MIIECEHSVNHSLEKKLYSATIGVAAIFSDFDALIFSYLRL